MTEVIVEVSCRICPGLIDRVPRTEVSQVVLEHFAQLHPARLTGRTPPAEGEDYLVLTATLVCDTCLTLIEPPWWEHTSTPPTPAAGQEDRDGRWLLCDPCHDLWTQRNLSGWVRRAWAVHRQRAPWLAQATPALRTDARAQLAGTLRKLLDRLDAGQRTTP